MSVALGINPNNIDARNDGLNANQQPTNQVNWQGRNVHQIGDIENPPEHVPDLEGVMATQMHLDMRRRHLTYFLYAIRAVVVISIPLMIAGIVLIATNKEVNKKGIILLATGCGIGCCAVWSEKVVEHRINNM